MKRIAKAGSVALAATCAIMFSSIPAVAEAASSNVTPLWHVYDPDEDVTLRYKIENWHKADSTSHTLLEVHNYGSSCTNMDLYNELKKSMPRAVSRADNEHFLLYAGNSYYKVVEYINEWYKSVPLPSGTYYVGATSKRSTPYPSWTYVGTLNIARYWNINVGFEGIGNDYGTAGITYNYNGSGGLVSKNDAIKVYEGDSFTFKVKPYESRTVEVRLDNKVISPNYGTKDTYTISARKGADDMKDSTLTITYLTNTSQKASEIRTGDLWMAYIGTYGDTKKDTLESVIKAMLNDPERPLTVRDMDTGKAIDGIVPEDFEVTANEGNLTAGAHAVSIYYKGTVGNGAQRYRPLKITQWVVINADMRWKQDIGSSIAGKDVSSTDFGVDILGTDTSKASITTNYYRGTQTSEDALIGSSVPTEPGTYTQVVSVNLNNGTYADPIARTFTIVDENGNAPGDTETPGADASNPGSSGSQFTLASVFINKHKGHTVSLKGIDKGTATKGGTIMFVCDNDGVICKVAIPKDPLKVSPAKKTFKASALKKRKEQFSITVKDAMGKLSYKSSSKRVSISKKGVVTVKKGTKKGTYKVAVTSKASQLYTKTTKTVKIVVK